MLPSRSRLNLSKISFNNFGGKRIESKELTLLVKEADKLKAGIIVNKKVAPKAVDRNRIKRIIYEALAKQNKFKGEIIIIVKNNLANKNTNQVQEILEKLIKI